MSAPTLQEQKADLFEGRSVPRTILKFAVPTVLSQLVTILYNLADTFFVGHTNDPVQVAALTLCFPLFMGLTMIGNLFGIGANSFISRSLGNQDPDSAEKTTTIAFYGSIATTVLYMIVLGCFLTPILRVIGATDESLGGARSYLTWTVLIGGIPTVASLMLGHLIRAEGRTKQASIGMALGGLLNIGLDPVFIQGLGMGAKGAGVATCISNCIALIYLLIVAFRSKTTVIRLNPAKITFVPKIMKEVILVGLPAAAVIVLGSAANIVLTHYMSAYGDVSIAAFGIMQKVGTIGIQITIGLTQGIMPLLGYSYGSGNHDRLKEINRWAFGIITTYAVLCIVLVELFARQIMLLFISEPETVAIGTQFLRRWFLCTVGMCFVQQFNTIFQAMGKWFPSLCLSIIRQGVLMIPVLILLNHIIGALGIVWAQPIADTISLGIGFIMYKVLQKSALSSKSPA